ncbi:lytic transglycosylase domain-containing protein [Parvularcula sp. LCG005]|uniref:lytic transglycosylase domain-containing protein n=1 Tax=Parvularcula sp. LCG005 TaxID=3078805 RepID=UPI0029435FEE|nr:lytic transglycosylase domain-containing protein [Parvularcula sp. LCG005]WOI54067.1 lytic transglycosylase domain-containing protein [Parvularcula sp. LCG005]
MFARIVAACAVLVASATVAGLTGAKAEITGPAAVLSVEDIQRYQAIFELQEDAKWPAADALIKKLENKILLGYVLEQRYMHPTGYRSSYPELSRWLAAYADHPNAQPLYTLAKRRQGRSAPPRRPASRQWPSEIEAPLHPDLAADYENSSRRAEVERIQARLRYLTNDDRPTQALNYLNDPRQFNMLTAAQTDRVRGWIAASYYYNGELTQARQVAELALRRSSDQAVLSHWVAGLVAYRQNDYARALKHFGAQAEIEYQEGPLRAGAAFWAARAALARGDVAAIERYLEVAADYPLTFYGQLALAQLGRDPRIDWSGLSLTEAEFEALKQKNARIERAAALAQVGLASEADLELKWAQGEMDPSDNRALVALADDLSLPSAAIILAKYAGADHGRRDDLAAALYPVPDFAPSNGFEVDPALLFGLIRQESKFLPEATSRVGARGLMQLMPRTASYVAGTSRASGRLYDPAYNMQLGQSYVHQLLTKYNNGSGDLFEMALSYNWGPGNFRRWRAQAGIEDQLLMLESVPNPEARHFVETVLTNYWVYRDRYGEPAPTRDAVAAGQPPIYQSISAKAD